MARQPQVAYAVKGGDKAHIHVPRRFLPIIVVPGFMGTRLCDEKKGPKGKTQLVFNPTGKPFGASPGAMVVRYKRLTQPAELAPADDHGYQARAERDAVQHIRHFNHLVTDTYGDLAKHLADLGDSDEFDHLGIRPVVYCAGYDWRQDNARSALRLAAVVEEALRETGAKKCVIVAHSMGGLVARYYCRALGGESQVHQLYLIGSPTLGAPTAFVQLKHGVHGAYLHDIAEAAVAEDVQGLVREGVGLAAQVVKGITGESFMETMGPAYFALCLGAGKLLRRHETAYFARQMTSIYQMMPSRIFCDKFKNWVVFDPMVTGHAPTGHMVVYPNLLEATMMGMADITQEIEGAGSKAGENIRKDYEKALGLGRHERTSPRAHRNVTTIDDIINELVEGAKAMGDNEDFSHFGDMAIGVQHLYEHAEHAFVDCRSPKHLYADIYTGLMDNVEQRPLVAANLALAERFDRALAMGRDKDKEHALSLFNAIVGPLMLAAGAVIDAIKAEIEGDDAAETEPDDEEEGHELKTYMHPRTTNIYANHLQVELGCMLLPTDVISYDDSNQVTYELIPFPVGLQGDGTVPADSAHPSEDALSHAFEDHHVIPGQSHSALPKANETKDYLKRRLNLGLDDWLKGEV